MPYKTSIQGPFFLSFPGAKESTQQALLLAALGNGVSELTNIAIHPDTFAWINALHQVGIVTQLDEESRSCIVAGANQQVPKKQATLTCHYSESILYLLLALCAASPGVYYIDGDHNLRALSLAQILPILHHQGVRFIPDDHTHIPLTLIGTKALLGGDVAYEDNIPNSFVSTLLILSPFAQNAFRFSLANTMDTQYFDITCKMMAEFGVLVHHLDKNQFFIPIPQQYQSRDYEIEADFSLAPYFFALAAITANQVITPLINRSSWPTLNKFLLLLEKMGCQLEENGTEFSVKGPNILQGIEINLSHFSFIFILLATIAPFASTPTKISYKTLSPEDNASLTLLKNTLLTLNVNIEMDENVLHIFPSTVKANKINAQNNAHIAMAMTILSAKIPGLNIEDQQCIRDQYPEFLMLWKQLKQPSYAEI